MPAQMHNDRSHEILTWLSRVPRRVFFFLTGQPGIELIIRAWRQTECAGMKSPGDDIGIARGLSRRIGVMSRTNILRGVGLSCFVMALYPYNGVQ